MIIFCLLSLIINLTRLLIYIPISSNMDYQLQKLLLEIVLFCPQMGKFVFLIIILILLMKKLVWLQIIFWNCLRNYISKLWLAETFNPYIECVQYACSFCFSDELYQITSHRRRHTASVCRSWFWLRRFDCHLRTRR